MVGGEDFDFDFTGEEASGSDKISSTPIGSFRSIGASGSTIGEDKGEGEGLDVVVGCEGLEADIEAVIELASVDLEVAGRCGRGVDDVVDVGTTLFARGETSAAEAAVAGG